MSFDVETTGLNIDDEIVTAAVAWSRDGIEVFSYAFHLDRFGGFSARDDIDFRRLLAKTLFNPCYQGEVIFHNANFDFPLLLRRYKSDLIRFCIRDFPKIYDTQALSRFLRNNKYISHADPKMERCHSLKFLAREHLGVEHTSFLDTVGQGNIRLTCLDKLKSYNRKDAELTLNLFFHLRWIAQKNVAEWRCFEEIEMPFCLAVVGLNWQGVPFDLPRALRLANNIKEQLFRLETEIFSVVGRSFNLGSQRELAGAIFRNPNLVYQKEGKKKCIDPLYETETGQMKVDISTLAKLRDRLPYDESAKVSRATINRIIQYLELAQSYEDVEKLQRHAFPKGNGYRLFPRITADAKTGRIKCGSPNVLGLAKSIFSKAIVGNDEVGLQKISQTFKSVRSLIAVLEDEEIYSIDISGLDLGVITAGLLKVKPDTYWKSCFEGHGPDRNIMLDTHLAILRRFSPSEYGRALSSFEPFIKTHAGCDSAITEYWATKEVDGNITFIHTVSGQVAIIPTTKIPSASIKEMKQIRGNMKTTNLAIPYNQGALKLAADLSEAKGRLVGQAEAAEVLRQYHATFPEIRQYQDTIANAVYRDGYIQTPFGRIIYADVFDELNMYQRQQVKSQEIDQYDFVVKANNKYWYVRTESWKKSDRNLIQDLRLVEGSQVLAFGDISVIYQLDRRIFRKKQKADHSRFSRKSESNLMEQSGFEENLFSITCEVDQALRFGPTWDSEADELRRSWCREGVYSIPEKNILLYRVCTSNPSSRFFRLYKPLMKVAKPFFATYCQAEAAIVAKTCLNEIQARFERETKTASLLLFVHDQYDASASRAEEAIVQKIMEDAIIKPKRVFSPTTAYYPVRFFGEFKNKGSRFS